VGSTPPPGFGVVRRQSLFLAMGVGMSQFVVIPHRMPASSLPIGFESVEVSAFQIPFPLFHDVTILLQKTRT